MKPVQVDTPRKGSWMETVNLPRERTPLSKMHPTFREAEILLQTQRYAGGIAFRSPQLAKEIGDKIRKHLS